VELAEPEDQDYYGIGSRMARWSATVLIGIIFSTLSPAITGLTFINFLLCRICYGYLLVFAENRKPDSGGLFFVNGLRHVQYGVMIYVILLIGVMARHAKSNGPIFMTVPAALYLIYCCYRFRVGFTFEMLPFQDVVSLPKGKESKFHADEDGSRAYTQRELTDPIHAPWRGRGGARARAAEEGEGDGGASTEDDEEQLRLHERPAAALPSSFRGLSAEKLEPGQSSSSSSRSSCPKKAPNSKMASDLAG